MDIEGLEAMFEYENLVLNDRRLDDRYRITGIDGLWDADIRDSREVNPQAHGETAFAAWYGGRTIVFEGFIEAGNINRMRNMARIMRGATNDITEHPLYIRTAGPGWMDRFEFDRLQEYNITGTVPVVSGGRLTGTVGSASTVEMITRGVKQYWQQATLEFVTGSSTSLGFYEVIIKDVIAADSASGGIDYLKAGIDLTAGPMLYVSTRIAGVNTYRDTMSMTIQPFTRYWLRGTLWDSAIVEGNPSSIGWVAFVELATFDLTDLPVRGKAGKDLVYHASTVPAYGYWTMGSANANFGPTKRGYSGFLFQPGDSSAHVRSFRAVPLVSRDARIMARKGSQISMKESQDGREVRRPFMLSMRASNPRWESSVLYSKQILGSRTTVVNDGNFEALPVIRLVGPQNLPRVSNLLANTTLALNASIPASDFYEIDIAAGTILDKAGTNQFSKLLSTSDWLKLLPGSNDIGWGRANATSGAEGCFVYWRNTQV